MYESKTKILLILNGKSVLRSEVLNTNTPEKYFTL